jgi:catechol 2,3-dioxygenase-like lactoylglutathione lyase family enzyme
MKITPVLVVEEIEPCLPFWVDRMGFESVAEVPEGDRIGFVILIRDGVELMLQSIGSVRADQPEFAPAGASRVASLFIEVDDFADTVKRLEGYPLAMPERTTFYGMREVGVFEPGGNIVIFAVRV